MTTRMNPFTKYKYHAKRQQWLTYDGGVFCVIQVIQTWSVWLGGKTEFLIVAHHIKSYIQAEWYK